jgi:hypothetical protein
VQETKMTITYSDKIHSLLVRWKGSVWKTVWKHLLIWLIIYYIIYFVLKFALTNYQAKEAAKVVAMFDGFCSSLPLVFILGFYVGQVVTRWWNQVMSIPWPDDCVVVANSYLFDGDHAKAIRETVARWLVLCEAMVFRQISPRIHKRFPQLDHLVDAGLMTKQELLMIRKIECRNTRWQAPLDWIVNKVIFPSEAQPVVKVAFCGSVNNFRNGMRQLFTYDWICIPLVYTQTVAIVVYGYFMFALIGHQYIGKTIDLYVPWLSILQFVFYVGWFNVAREMMYPMGEDEDDLELNCILDRHAAVAFSLATEVREESPDIIFDEKIRKELGQKMSNNLTYSVKATEIVNHPPKLRAHAKVPVDHQEQVKIQPLTNDKKKKVPWTTNTPPNFF